MLYLRWAVQAGAAAQSSRFKLGDAHGYRTSKAQALIPSDLPWQRNATAAARCLLLLFIAIPLCILAMRAGVGVEEGEAAERQCPCLEMLVRYCHGLQRQWVN